MMDTMMLDMNINETKTSPNIMKLDVVHGADVHQPQKRACLQSSKIITTFLQITIPMFGSIPKKDVHLNRPDRSNQFVPASSTGGGFHAKQEGTNHPSSKRDAEIIAYVAEKKHKLSTKYG